MVKSQQLLNEAILAGLYTKPEPVNKIIGDEEGLELCEELAKLPFWCNDDTLHKRNINYQHTAKCCINHIIGLPRHSATGEEMPLTPYQVDMADKIIHGREKFGNKLEQQRKALKIHIKKARQMGFTEIVLRLILYLSFTRYKGRKIAIIAGTSGSLARKNLRRLARLFRAISPVIKLWLRRERATLEGVINRRNTLEIVNGTEIEAFSATEEAMTGDTGYKCVFVDETTKWKLIDDSPVFNSFMPIVRTNGADLFLVSTPKGPVKMFHEIDMKHDTKEYVFLVYDIMHTLGNLNTQQEVDSLIASSTEDPDQEYMCKYKSGRDSIFGTISDEDQQGKTEWLVDDNEDDEYVENLSNDADIYTSGDK